ncbi:CinA family protein [Gilvimarinus polysaccharolyticus]|uniref:CinA family protein n=1 Tax=Gilvimarinus polysaccharolyticus TaxID=863921 RepID=UPI00067318C1|nr:nicotinamide-nucleotide amidohydrolase family protein [Gilvimarinus polysaccharolyticus]
MPELTASLTLPHLAAELGAYLSARGWQVTAAESCTGGGVASAITATPGCSQWFEMGFVTYANSAKVRLLGVSETTLADEGAVSRAVVEQMALGAKAASGADLAVAVSGIAGPSGGTRDKPVGTVWFGWADAAGNVSSECYVYQGDREQVRHQACVTALRELVRLAKV